MMNILFISHENNLGGGTKSLLTIIDEISVNENYNIYVFIPKFNEKLNQGRLDKELDKRNIKYIKFRSYWWMKPMNENLSAKILLKQVINIMTSLRVALFCKRNRIDIIHSNSSVINIGGLVSKLTKIKHIWHIREFGAEDHGLNFVFDDKKSFEFINKNSTKVICISKSIYDKYVRYIDKENLEVIYNGIKINDSFSNEKRRVHKSFNILIVGRIKKSKGQEYAIKALNELIRRGYSDIYLYLACTYVESYFNYLLKLVKEFKIESYVSFIGYTNRIDDIRENMDLELVCSQNEAFGRVTVEAMMNMNPVIGADRGATKELIRDKYNGLLYKEGDYIDLANKIEEVYNLKDKGRYMGVNGRKYVIRYYSSKTNCKNILKVYDSIK